PVASSFSLLFFCSRWRKLLVSLECVDRARGTQGSHAHDHAPGTLPAFALSPSFALSQFHREISPSRSYPFRVASTSGEAEGPSNSRASRNPASRSHWSYSANVKVSPSVVWTSIFSANSSG